MNSPQRSDIDSEQYIEKEKEVANLDSASSPCIRRLNQEISYLAEVDTEPLSASSLDHRRDAHAVTSGTLLGNLFFEHKTG